MQFNTSINPQARGYDASAGMRRLEAEPPRFYGDPSLQQHFSDVYRQEGKKQAMDLSRMNSQAQAGYTQKAQDAQNESVLAGLGLLGRQRDNAQQRQQSQQQMAYGWLNDIYGGVSSLLGGLL
jgi:hypothetical protein